MKATFAVGVPVPVADKVYQGKTMMQRTRAGVEAIAKGAQVIIYRTQKDWQVSVYYSINLKKSEQEKIENARQKIESKLKPHKKKPGSSIG